MTAKNRAEEWLDSMVEDGATPYSTQWFREEAIHRYNAGVGGSSSAYREWLGDEWVIVDTGGPSTYVYVERVLRKLADCD